VSTPLLLALFFFVWGAYVHLAKIDMFILPSPTAVFSAWGEVIRDPRAWQHTLVTIGETLGGFAVAVVIGIGGGVLLGRARWLEATLNPFVVGLQVVPKVALIPLFIVWFGFGPTSKVVVSAVIAFFPILSNTLLGVKSVQAGHRDVMVSLNASRWAIFRRLELPNALPYILTGMEVGVVLALIGAIVGEYLGGNQGLGYLLVAKMNAYETDMLFAVILHMTVVGFLFYFSIGLLRRVLIPWHESMEVAS
ncbi:MAG: ABC transporter permease, partial [Burkholderiaceae bacterium]